MSFFFNVVFLNVVFLNVFFLNVFLNVVFLNVVLFKNLYFSSINYLTHHFPKSPKCLRKNLPPQGLIGAFSDL